MRRWFTRTASAVCLCLLLTGVTAFAAQAESEARQRLEKAINSVLSELDKPALHNETGREAVLAQVESIIYDFFDFAELSMRTVGPQWKTLTPDQQKRFIDVFTTLLRETYLEKLDGYDGETVSYTGETSSTKGDKVEVQTIVNMRKKPVPVAYRMLKKDTWRVYDVIIEGVSMVQNYRTQFQDMLSKGDPEALIRQVGVKAEEVRATNKKSQMSK